jgi:iduronate 2-sulfatase
MNYKLLFSLSLSLMSGLYGFSQKPKPNILFIAIDDLKPNLNCYGFSEVKSPNIDRLANQGTLFSMNYCQQAVCAPTRASLLTGLRPDRTEVWDLKTLIRDRNPHVVTLPQFLKDHGYVTAALGKVYDQRSVDKKHDALSWSEPYKNKYEYPAAYGTPIMGFFQSPELKKKYAHLLDEDSEDKASAKEPKMTTESMDVPDEAYPDGAMVKQALADMKNYAKGDKPFFLAVGIRKPHLPFVAPKKYWDMYDRSKIELAKWQQPSVNGPEIAYHSSGELRAYQGITSMDGAEGLLKLSPEKQRELIHGYYACISYADALVGKLLDELKASGLDKNTIVVLWGDHGWHLGDHSLWNKHSNFEQATKAPLIISLPGQKQKIVYNSPTEFVDVYPTLVQLAGLPVSEQLDGVSLVSALNGDKKPVKQFAISQYPRKQGGEDYMGYALRSNRYRYVEWVKKNTQGVNPAIVATELYDYEKDPNETRNLANENEFAKIKDQMALQLHNLHQEVGKKKSK